MEVARILWPFNTTDILIHWVTMEVGIEHRRAESTQNTQAAGRGMEDRQGLVDK